MKFFALGALVMLLLGGAGTGALLANNAALEKGYKAQVSLHATTAQADANRRTPPVIAAR